MLCTHLYLPAFGLHKAYTCDIPPAMDRVFLHTADHQTVCFCDCLQMLPLFVAFTIFVLLFFILNKGARNVVDLSFEKAAWVAAICAGGCALVTALAGYPLIGRRVKQIEKNVET